MKTRFFPVAVVFAGVFGFGVAHGVWTDRWKLTNEPEASAARLQDVPLNVGEWQGQPAAEIGARQLEIGEIAGYLHRTYVHRRTGVTVTVLILCGRAGPISVHTPDVCYRGLGYDFTTAPAKHTVATDTGTAELICGRMVRSNPADEGGAVRIFWGWTADGTWRSPKWPRVTFARAPALYKMYVQRGLGQANEPLSDDPCNGFLSAFVPELKRVLYPPT